MLRVYILILCALLQVIFTYQLKQGSSSSCFPKPSSFWNSSDIHVIFIGDSLTRYQFLATAFRIYHDDKIPHYIVNEKLHRSWLDFFKNTTNIFEGSMKCDCFRYENYRKLGNSFSFSRENRFFSFQVQCEDRPVTTVLITFIQFFGDRTSLHGRVFPTNIADARPGRRMRKSRWKHLQLHSAIKGFIGQMRNKPTHIIVNAGIWPHKELMKNLKIALSAANDAAPNVYWKETSPTKTDALRNANFHESTLGHPTDIDILAREYCEQENLCNYVEFPRVIPSDLLNFEMIPEYWDSVHFAAPELYILWSKVLFEKMNLSSISKLL